LGSQNISQAEIFLEVEILAFLILSGPEEPLNFCVVPVLNVNVGAIPRSLSNITPTMSAVKKRKLNGSSVGAAAPKVHARMHLQHGKKPSKAVTKPSARQVVPPKPAEPESSEEEEEKEQAEKEGEEEDGALEEENSENGDDSEIHEEEGQKPEDASTTEPTAKKTFADLGVIESLCEACENLGFKHPTPIQEQSIPLALQGRDM
jgi:ATP-dependent RNA helicase DDX47/RRP3